MKKIVLLFWLVLTSLFLQVPNTQAQESIFDTSSSSLFSNDDEFLNVDQAFDFNFHQQGKQLEITFNIAEGYYLYRHQFKFSAENAEIIPIVMPKGEDHEDEFFGVQQIFTEKLSFVVELENIGDNANIKVRYQGCATKGLCYPPKKKTVELSKIIVDTPADSSNVLPPYCQHPKFQHEHIFAGAENSPRNYALILAFR